MKLFPLLFGSQIFAKKFLGLASLFSTIGLSVYFGVSKPRHNNSEVTHLIGSQPLLESYRGNPYEQKFNEAYLVKDFRRSSAMPTMDPALYEKHMNPSTRDQYLHEFNGTMKTYLEKDPPPLNKSYERHFLQKVNMMAPLKRDYSSISEVAIPYMSYLYIKQIRDLEKTHLIQDLIWSLIEESREKKLVIRPDSIDIDFQLEKVPGTLSPEDEKKKFPLDTNKVRNFQLRLKVYNSNNELKTIFKSIPLLPYQEADLIVTIDRAEIRPFNLNFYDDGHNISVKWGLVPIAGSKFHITQASSFPFSDSKSFSMDRLSLMYGKSRFIKTVAHRPTVSNSPTFQDFVSVAAPYLMVITPDQIKKDLETWYGAALAYQIRLRANDLQHLVEMMEMNISRDKKGRDYTGLEMMVNSSAFRDSLYASMYLSGDAVKVVEQFFNDSNKNDVKITHDELKWLVKSIAWAVKDMANNMKVTLSWKQEPTLSAPSDDDNSPFQAVSFELEQKLSWDKKVTIPFKGCWKKEEKKFEEVESQDKCSSDGYFDFSKKLDKLSDLLTPIANLISPVVKNLLPDVSKFVGWSKFEIDKDEHVITTYKAENSSIRPSLSEVSDYRERRNLVPGWKAMDIRTTYNLSNFHKFFYKIYEKIDTYKDQSGVNVTSSLGLVSSGLSAALSGEITKNPISFAIHMINQLFDKNYFTQKSTPEHERPWPMFFKALLQQTIPIESSQLFAGYSSSMFNIESWVHEKLHDTSSNDTSSNDKIYKPSKDWQKKENGNTVRDIPDEAYDFPATFKSRQMKTLMQSYSNLYSSSFPRNPIMFNFRATEEWNNFLQYEGSTSVGFINNRNMVKNIIQNMIYHTSPNERASFPTKQSVDWGKVKLSFTQLNLEQALKSVLNMKNQISTLANTILQVPFNSVLGEYIQRDAMMVTVNMMLEDGSANITKDIVHMLKLSPYSTFSFSVTPNLDKTKLHTSIKKFGV